LGEPQLLHHLVENDIRILRTHFSRILLVVAGQITGRAGRRVAVFVQAHGDVDFAAERRALHHDVVLAERVIQGEGRVSDSFHREGWAAWAAGGSGDDEQRRLGIDFVFKFLINGNFTGDRLA